MSLLLAVAFPIVPHAVGAIDSGPTVEITVEAVADYYADSMYPESAYGNRLVLYVGNSYDRAQNLSGPARIYIQFDLSGVPNHAHVLSAQMTLYQLYAPASNQTYEVHVVRTAWNESTMNWRTQPSSDPTVLSTTKVPPAEGIWVSWNVTSATQAWVNNESSNYGLMIRIQNERIGVAGEASGFYSREYSKEGVRPKLHILCASEPPFTYILMVHVNGLPSDLTSVIIADDRSTIRVSGGDAGYFLFESGTTHRIIADEYVVASGSVRYHASAHSTTATNEGDFTVTYSPQFLVRVKSEPRGHIETGSGNWYDAGVRITTPTAQEAFDEGPTKRTVFEGWYVNDVKQAGNSIEYVVTAPANLTARYTIIYNVNASSPFGKVSGSGWHVAGSSVEIVVEPTYLPAEGFLGYLGFGTSFDHWTGTVESTSSLMTVTVDGPVEEKAIWREDRSRFLVGVAVVISILVVLMVLRRRSRHSASQGSAARHTAKNTNRQARKARLHVRL